MMPDRMLLLPELFTVKVRPLAKLMPNALLMSSPRSKMSPLAVLLVPMALFKVMSPPYMLMGPFTLLLDAQVMLAVLVAVPTVNPLKPVPNTQPVLLTALEKLAEVGAIVKVPVVLAYADALASAKLSAVNTMLPVAAVTALPDLEPR